MRFLLDANMPRAAAVLLERSGHDTVHVRDTALKHATDQRISEFARTEQRVIVTRDLDFADVRRYPPESSPGYLVLRVPESWVATEIVELLQRFLDVRGLVEQIPAHLVILRLEKGARLNYVPQFRPLPSPDLIEPGPNGANLSQSAI